jgi:hypothetical protein
MQPHDVQILEHIFDELKRPKMQNSEEFQSFFTIFLEHILFFFIFTTSNSGRPASEAAL